MLVKLVFHILQKLHGGYLGTVKMVRNKELWSSNPILCVCRHPFFQRFLEIIHCEPCQTTTRRHQPRNTLQYAFGKSRGNESTACALLLISKYMLRGAQEEYKVHATEESKNFHNPCQSDLGGNFLLIPNLCT